VNIAIIGTGISGLSAAWLLDKQHEVAVFEAEPRIGGHTATIDFDLNGQSYSVDTGFIVFNDRTYPHFQRLLSELDVAYQPTEMSFSVSSETDGLEYAGTNLNTLFAQRSNLIKPAFWRLIKDILRFNKEAQADLHSGLVNDEVTLGQYLDTNRYSAIFRDRYLIPMGAAIWSCGMHIIENFPLKFFVRFFHNHGLLEVANRPQWFTLIGGSKSYLPALTAPFADRLHCDDAVTRVDRDDDGITVIRASGTQSRHDAVVFACHSDQALALIGQPTSQEQSILGAIPYQDNEVVLHTDTTLLPKRTLAWSSWNYRLRRDTPDAAVLTYNMNILQRLDSEHTFCVTMNDSKHIDPEHIIGQFNYAHPVFTAQGVSAQQRWSEINGHRTWFCGAYWANGFHEDGLVSAIRVAEALGVKW